MQAQKNLKGIRISTVNMVMLALSLVLFVIVLYNTVQISNDYEASIKATEDYIAWEKAAHDIHVGTDFLSDQARLYAQTFQPEYACKYFHEFLVNRSRQKAVDFVKKHTSAAFAAPLEHALELSNKLSEKEIYAMRLVVAATLQNIDSYPDEFSGVELTAADEKLDARGKVEKARDMLFDTAYQRQKNKIIDALSTFLQENLEKNRKAQLAQTRKLGSVLGEQRIILIALSLLNILTFTMIIVLIIKPLRVYLKCIKEDKMIELVGAYEFKHLALTYNDIFAIKEYHDKMLKHKAEHDPLTGLYNRAAFDSLRDLLSQEEVEVGLLLVDVDKFKEVNDTYGHLTGDNTLRRVANLLKHSFRSDDYCIRIGGDEFAVILSGKIDGIIESTVKDKIAGINHVLMHPEECDQPPVSISVGVAFSRHGFDRNLYANADAALYSVKEAGRCGCRFYDPATMAANQER